MWPLNIIWKLCILPTKGRLWHSNLAQVTAHSRLEEQQEALGHTCAVETFRLQSPGVQALIETPLMVPASAEEGAKIWTQLLMGPQTWLVFLPSPNPSAGCLLHPKASGCCRYFFCWAEKDQSCEFCAALSCHLKEKIIGCLRLEWICEHNYYSASSIFIS